MRLAMLVGSIVLSCVPAVVSAEERAEVWQVVEGNNGSIKGIWQIKRDGDKIVGSADMARSNGALLKYGVSGEFKSGRLTIHRIMPTDGAACIYLVDRKPDHHGHGNHHGHNDGGDNHHQRGIIRDGKITGTMICNSANYVWNVTVTEPPKQD